MKSSILLSVPKYVAISPNPLQKVPVATITSPALLALEELSKPQDGSVRGKKRRLDHLTWEEKIQRKKLKNRVAAQTSRDRKKAKMDVMEQTIDDLTERAEILQNKCHTLEVINESLLLKNQKLDNEVQELGKQLKLLQQQLEEKTLHSTTLASNICRIYLPSAEGSGIEVNVVRSHETTTKQKKIPRQSSICSSIEDNNALFALQDLLKDFDVNKFKDFDVEEFAEFLLTGVTEDLERNNAKSSDVNAQSSSQAEQLFGRMVGSTSECMESGGIASEFNSQSIPNNGTRNFCVSRKCVREKVKQKPNRRKNEYKEKLVNNNSVDLIDSSTMIPIDPSIQPDTLYGTYNEKTHSITICLPDSNDPIEEVTEEVCCEEENEALKIPTLNYTTVDNDAQILMLSSSASNIEEDLDYDPVKEFLSIPSINNRPNSPFSMTSDLGYGSIGSPDQISKENENFHFNELWDNTFTELFPTLL